MFITKSKRGANKKYCLFGRRERVQVQTNNWFHTRERRGHENGKRTRCLQEPTRVRETDSPAASVRIKIVLPDSSLSRPAQHNDNKTNNKQNKQNPAMSSSCHHVFMSSCQVRTYERGKKWRGRIGYFVVLTTVFKYHRMRRVLPGRDYAILYERVTTSRHEVWCAWVVLNS